MQWDAYRNSPARRLDLSTRVRRCDCKHGEGEAAQTAVSASRCLRVCARERLVECVARVARGHCSDAKEEDRETRTARGFSSEVVEKQGSPHTNKGAVEGVHVHVCGARAVSYCCQTVALHVCGLAHVLAAAVHSGLHCDQWGGWAVRSLLAVQAIQATEKERKHAPEPGALPGTLTYGHGARRCKLQDALQRALQRAACFTAPWCQGGVAPSFQQHAKPQNTAISAARIARIGSHEKTHGTSK